MLKYLAIATAVALVAACGAEPASETTPPPTEETPAPAPAAVETVSPLLEVSSAAYAIEPTHASVVWSVSHNGLSNYTARFMDFSAALIFNAEDPTLSTLTASINPLSVRTDHPEGPDWDTTLGTDEKWFNATAFPAITYASTGVTLTGETTGIVQGDLTFLGVTKQVPLSVTFNGLRNFAWFGERDVIGFSATATLKRSDFGMTALLPGIGDEVTLTIETEFLQAE